MASGGSPARITTRNLSPSLIRKLTTVRHASPETVVLTGGQPQIFCEMVVWLEDTKIRLWNQKKREALKKTSDGVQWVATFTKYLDDLGMKGVAVEFMSRINGDVNFQHALLDRLASFAVEEVYLDRVDHLATSMETDAKNDNTAQYDKSFQQMIPPTNKCMALMDLPQLPANAPKNQIRAALKCILVRLDENALRDESRPHMNHEQAVTLLKAYSSGVNVPTHSADLQTLIKILRLISVDDLRKTQEVVNRSISRLQEITGDPKTDTSLYTAGK